MSASIPIKPIERRLDAIEARLGDLVKLLESQTLLNAQFLEISERLKGHIAAQQECALDEAPKRGRPRKHKPE